MEQNPKVNLHKKVCERLNKIYCQKNHDYGDSFHQSFLEEGMAMPRIRLTDKLLRFKNLTRNKAEVVEESMVDTLLDLANYAIMTIMEIEGDDINEY